MPTWTLIENLRGPQGIPGDPGTPGPAGPAGPPGAPVGIQQTAPAATWTIPHALGGRPQVLVLLDSDPTSPVWTDVTYPDDHTVVVSLPSAATGWAYLG